VAEIKNYYTYKDIFLSGIRDAVVLVIAFAIWFVAIVS
jgi:hypothetical protein